MEEEDSEWTNGRRRHGRRKAGVLCRASKSRSACGATMDTKLMRNWNFGDDNDMETELDSKSSGAIYWRILLEQSTTGLVLAELIQRIGTCSMGAVY